MSFITFLVGIFKAFFTAFFLLFLFAIIATAAIIFFIRYKIQKMREEFSKNLKKEKKEIDENIIDL